MSSRTQRECLTDMLDAIQRARTYINSMSYEEFSADLKTQDATIRTLEVLGEASKGLSADIKNRFSEIPWKSIARLRDKLIHNYFGVNLDIVWQVVTLELPALERQIMQVLAEIGGS
ncbi:DUF86 domain-containing protein [[Phormidium] sp. ETS-05]|uniref:HepT-like ribonuclease domain-containing protein n=1 Tax=[Phormidium] sp. ETS-05 TaxID=222819 RepID=UPI0018EF211D|nr:DUF86 domain-containing protein [[Phormidium] sp. ETS-05]